MVARAGIVALFLVAFFCAAAAVEETAPVEVVRVFRADCAAKAAEAEQAGTMTVVGRDGWLFFDSELRHLAAGKFWGEAAAGANRVAKPEFADPLPAMLDFKQQLDRAGIELLLVPVPAKAIVHSDKLSAAITLPVGRLDPEHVAFYELLRRQGIHLLDLTPAFLQQAQKGDGEPFCRQDTHWSGQGCALAGKSIADDVRNRPWLKGVKKLPLEQETKSVQITGDLYGAMKRPPAEIETIALRFVGVRKEGKLEPIEEDPASPVVLMGDSHCLVFHAGGDMHAEGAGLADQLALEPGFALDLIGVRGSGATPARINLMRSARTNPDYLKGKKLIVWCFSVREFTEGGGWQKVPVVK